MSTSMRVVDGSLVELAGALAAAVYLIVTRRRSPRAAKLGVTATGLLVACAFYPPRGYWVQAAVLTAAYVLLIWAILADRPPATHEQE